jgi:threonine dehydrogenase-like Zn-dependent dehydrogenase
MKGLVYHGKGDIRCESVPDPTPPDVRSAVLKVERAAICGSDLHLYHADFPPELCVFTIGHEFVGEIVEVGSAVRELTVGQRVLSPFTTCCGRCFFCRRGLTSRCSKGQLFGWVEQGRGLHGAQAELVRVPLAEGTLAPIPEFVGSLEALLLGDVLATGYYCARQAAVAPGVTCVVIGCGPVGLMAVVGAQELGASVVFAVDSIPERLELAARFGAQPVDRLATDPVELVTEATDGRGADAVCEAVGSADALRMGVDLLRPGGTLSIVGVHNEPSFSLSPAEAYDKNLTLRIGRCPARALLDELLPLVRGGKYDLSSIVSHRLPLEQGRRGYEIFDKKRDGCTKVVLTP